MFKDFVNNDQFEDLLELVEDLSWNGIGRRNRVTAIRAKVETCMTKPAFLEALGSADAARTALPQHPWFRKRIQRDFDSNFENSSWNRFDGAACLVLKTFGKLRRQQLPDSG